MQHRTAIGRKIWAIAEGYIPSGGISGDRKLTPHETACILNAGDEDAQITITLYFTDREPAGPYRSRCLRDARCTSGSTTLPIVVQHSRLDSRQAELALLSTLAWPAP